MWETRFGVECLEALCFIDILMKCINAGRSQIMKWSYEVNALVNDERGGRLLIKNVY